MAVESQQRTIGKYQVLGPLGRGAMGLVYKARDPEIGRIVAVKTLRKLMTSHLHDADAALERFRNEARSAGNLRHQNIITIFEIGRDGDTPFIVMDYVEGKTFEELIDERKRLTPIEAIKYLRQVGAGLDYAHKKSIIHRDIKPANILVDNSENVFILDFGIASIQDSISGVEPDPSAPVMGTPSYMAPEQVLNEKLDHRADLFALAIVAFECLTGERPFRGENFTEVISNIVAGKMVALTAVAPHLPLSLEAEFRRALAREREGRFANATEMIEAFARALRVETSTATEAGGDRRRERPPGFRVSGMSGDSGGPTVVGWSEGRAGGFPVTSESAPGGFSGSKVDESAELNITFPVAGVSGGRFRRWTAAVGGVCVVLAGAVVFELMNGAGPAETGPTPEEIEARLANVGRPPPIQSSSPEAVEDARPLVEPSIEAAPAGKPLKELTDKQLLGVIVGRTSAESSVIEALKLGRERRIAQLADAAVVPLSNDAYLVRVEAAKVLLALSDRRVVPRLALALDDHDPLVRAQVARSLGGLRDRRALSSLSARLGVEDSVVVRREVKRAIAEISGVPFPE